MEVGKLTVELRSGKGKGLSRRLRQEGMIPGVCYGHGLSAPLPVTVDPKALKASLDPVRGQNTVIDITVQDNGSAKHTVKAMVWEWQVHPLRRNLTHVDLIAIDPDKMIEVSVPIKLTGKAVGTVEGGQIHVVRHEVEIRAKPAEIPTEFVLDITPLDIGDALHVSDLEIPEGVELAVPESYSVVSCVAPKAEKVEEPLEGELAEGELAEGEEGAEGAKPAEGDAKEGGEKKE